MVEIAGALIRDENNRFMICRRPPTKGNPLKWEFPGGKWEKGESCFEALIRECYEELDITVRPLSVVCDVTHEYPDITVHLTVCDSVIEQGSPRLLEHVDLKWISADEMESIDFCGADIDIIPEIKAFMKSKEKSE